MKKIVTITFILVVAIFLVGCVEYKSFGADDTQEEEIDLVDEIAAIEEDIAAENEDLLEEPALEETTDLIEETTADGEYVITVDESELIDLMANIVDPDEDNVTYTFSPPLSREGAWQTSYGDAGEYLVTLRATDGQLTTEGKIRLVVNRVNVPPVLSGIKDITVKEGETINFEPLVEDPNNDPVTVTVSEPLRSGLFVTDHTSSGEYQITVSGSDGELASEETFTLTITNVNVLPELANLPESISVKEGETVTVQPEITDLDGDNVQLSISEPVGDDGVWETDFTDHGDYIVTVTANDGKDTVTQRLRVNVEDVNMPPQIVDVYIDVN
ncbi:hypothetical protein HOI26_02500 [Candidatus Woesearchaeota archaeon]|jgi:hypothetical protein|nr:hypothetical protein [Candidatus Woesearchaeota archaeon]MBT5739949.1 hypothetical protein [Candidatus Woesearchaeota archaeon]